MTNPVEMFSIRTDVFATSSTLRRTARCTACGASVDEVVPEKDAEPCEDFLARALTARGCEHWREPFEDRGVWCDPRTEWSRVLDEPGLRVEIHGFAPVQGEGTVDGLPCYYRNRGIDGDERFAIGATAETDASEVNDEWRTTAAGWLWRGDADESVPRAAEFILACVKQWRDAGGPACDKNRIEARRDGP